jgi:hypothetical protein
MSTKLFAEGNYYCYLVMALLTAVGQFYPWLIPIHVSMTIVSMAIIMVGSYQSLEKMVKCMVDLHVHGKESDSVESVSKNDAMWFPVMAGSVLCGLYFLITYFGKEIMNPIILAYIGVSSSLVFKEIAQGTIGDKV